MKKNSSSAQGARKMLAPATKAESWCRLVLGAKHPLHWIPPMQLQTGVLGGAERGWVPGVCPTHGEQPSAGCSQSCLRKDHGTGLPSAGGCHPPPCSCQKPAPNSFLKRTKPQQVSEMPSLRTGTTMPGGAGDMARALLQDVGLPAAATQGEWDGEAQDRAARKRFLKY